MATPSPLQVVIVYGSVRTERRGIRLVRFLEHEIAGRGHETTVFDPLELQLPLLDKMYKEYPKGEAPAVLESLAGHIKAADGFLIVSGEYNHSIPPALKNLLDHFLEEWFWRPSALATYSAGRFAGVRAGVALRAVLAELGMPSISSEYPIANVQDQFSEDGTPHDSGHAMRLTRFLEEFEWHMRALKAARAQGTPY